MVYSVSEWVRRGYAVNMRFMDGLARAIKPRNPVQASNRLEGLS